MKQLEIDEILLDLERKRIKNMYLRVLPPDGRVSVSAPMKVSDDEIRRFVSSKLTWIRKQQEKIKGRTVQEKPEYLTGDTLRIWGGSYRLVRKEAVGRSRVSVVGEEVLLYCKADSTREQREKLLNQLYAQLLQQEIPYLLTRWEKIIGVKSNSYHLRNMKTRWGSCNIRTGEICLNLQLAKKTPHCLEYVVVHELVHLLEPSHNQVFKAYMDRFLPRWRGIKKELNGVE